MGQDCSTSTCTRKSGACPGYGAEDEGSRQHLQEVARPRNGANLGAVPELTTRGKGARRGFALDLTALEGATYSPSESSAGSGSAAGRFKRQQGDMVRRVSTEHAGHHLGRAYFDQCVDELSSLEWGDVGDDRENAATQGPVLQQRPVFKFRNGARYTGQWMGKERHGEGVQVWPDGASYSGEWGNNTAEGVGLFTHADGDTYCGQWRSGVADGIGRYNHWHDNGEISYVGCWSRDLQHGRGVETWETQGCRFEGQFDSGQKHGYGRYVWRDGACYEGVWKRNCMCGAGYWEGADGRRFCGQWRNGMIHGLGLYGWPDGRSYTGKYISDRKSGYGVFEWPDGRKYEGFWEDGRQHGEGIFTDQDGRERWAKYNAGQLVPDLGEKDGSDESDDAEKSDDSEK